MPLHRRRTTEPRGETTHRARPLALVGDEETWVARIRAGDATAFEALFQAYYGPLWAYALGLVDSPELAEECVQDVLFRVWAHRGRLIPRKGLGATA